MDKGIDRVTIMTAYLAEVARFYILVTLLAAVIGKLMALATFAASIVGLTGMGRSAARGTSYAVVAAEALVAILLLVGGRWTSIGMAFAFLLFLVFTAVIAAALARRKQVHCNCFGGQGRRISGHDLIRNASLIAAAIYCLAQAGPPPVTFATIPLLLGIALILFLISAHLHEISTLLRQR